MTTAATAASGNAADSERNVPLPLRGDTFLGVCEAIGQDLGINPTWLRVAFAALLLWNPEVVIAAYLGLGIVVAATRLLFPDRRVSANAGSQPSPQSAEDRTEAVREEELLAA